MVNQQAASGFVIRNENGSPIIVGAHSVGQNTINAAKCLVLSDGLWMANSRGFKRIIVEGDSKLVIKVVRGAYHVPRDLGPFLLIFDGW